MLIFDLHDILEVGIYPIDKVRKRHRYFSNMEFEFETYIDLFHLKVKYAQNNNIVLTIQRISRIIGYRFRLCYYRVVHI